MKIGIDMDNVLNNMSEEWMKTYNRLHMDSMTIDDIHCWNIEKYVKCGRQIFQYLNPSLFERLIPLPHSVEVTRRLAKNHELFLVTATSPWHVDVKMKWMDKYFPHILSKNIIICHRKELIDVDLLIDDGAHNIEAFPKNTIVFDYAWNRNCQGGPDSVRLKNWLEIEAFLDKQYASKNGERRNTSEFRTTTRSFTQHDE